MLSAPINGQLNASVVSPPSVQLQWNGSAGVDHYDLYRSTVPLEIGSKINVAPLTDGGSPNYPVLVTDDGVSTSSPPPVGTPLFYKLVAATAAGDYGPMSASVQATIESGAFYQDPIAQTLIDGLRADATLMGMLHNSPDQVRPQKRIRESGDLYPYVVVWRKSWSEDPLFKDERHGTLEYVVTVVNNSPAQQVVTNVINRVAKLFDGNPGKNLFNGSASIMVLMTMFMGGGPESYSDSPKLWFQEGRLKITGILLAT